MNSKQAGTPRRDGAVHPRAWRKVLAHAGLAFATALASVGVGAEPATVFDDWRTYGQGSANQRYSPLADISTANVSALAPAWIFQTGVVGTFPTNPLVVEGVMYLTTPFNHVIALDAATGQQKWRYTHTLARKELCCGSHNRGLAWQDGRLFMVTADARLLALEAATGKVVWDVPVVDPMTGNPVDLEALKSFDPAHQAAFDRAVRFAGNMAPAVHGDRIFVGVSGTGYSAVLGDAEQDSASVLGRPGVRDGLRAFMSAYSVKDGRLLWRWYSTADKGWEGEFAEKTSFGDDLGRDIAAEKAALAKYADAWKTGGGSIYSTPSIDPELGLLFFGTGNASPGYADSRRPGDNLYTSSVVALELATGKLRWYHQLVPHDLWGYDAASPPVLLDAPDAAGNKVPALAVASKSGWMYVFDRRNGQALRRSEAFVPQSQPMFRHATPEGVEVAPGAAGGANWPPSAFHPGTGLVYVPATHNPTRYHLERDAKGEYVTVLSFGGDVPRTGTFSAIDPATGRIAWQMVAAAGKRDGRDQRQDKAQISRDHYFLRRRRFFKEHVRKGRARGAKIHLS